MSNELIPRFWPILFMLRQLRKVETYRRLEYLLYAAKRKGLRTAYDFALADSNLVSPQIKLDLNFLRSGGYLKMKFHTFWVFEITRRGDLYASNLVKNVSRRQQGFILSALREIKDASYSELLENLIGKDQLKFRELNSSLKRIKQDVQILADCLRNYPPSHNLLLIAGSLDYIKEGVERLELAKNVKKLIPLVISGYLKELIEIVTLTLSNTDVLANMDIHYVAEDFELLQEVFREAGILSLLQEKHNFAVYNEI